MDKNTCCQPRQAEFDPWKGPRGGREPQAFVSLHGAAIACECTHP